MDQEKKDKWKKLFRHPGQGMKDIKRGIETLSPAQQLHGQIVGTKGTLIGLVFAWGMMLFRGLWYISIVMFFAIWLNAVALIGLNQKYKAIIQMQNDMEAAEVSEKR